MTHQEKLSFVISKIHEAVPEIKELKFGCSVIMDGKYKLVYIGDYFDDNRMGDSSYFYDDNGSLFKYAGIISYGNNIDPRFEIIGRKMGIADVLIVVQESDKKPSYFNIGSDGGFYEVKYTYPDGNKCLIEHNGISMFGGWDLKNDDITKQSEETISFLYDLLKD